MTTFEKSGGERPRAYLDTNLVSGIRKQDLGAEQQALRRILGAPKQGTVALVTSRVTHEEIKRLPPGTVREAHEDIYALLSDVPLVDEELLVPRPVKAAQGLFGPAVVTQQHFVTYDKATILRHRAAIEDQFSILVCLPSELATELEL